MKYRIATLTALMALTWAQMGCAAETAEAQVKKAFLERYPKVEVMEVRKTPLAGIFEIYTGNDLVYVDKTVNYLIKGHLVDTRKRVSLTDARLKELEATQPQQIEFSKLPLDLAIKDVRGNGKRRVAVFSDPDCPWCKRLEQETFKDLTDVTIYTFLLPLDGLHPEARRKAAQIWCSDDKVKAWHDYMLRNQEPTGDGKCATPLDKITDLAGKLGIRGTPGLVLGDGTLVKGFLPKETFDKAINGDYGQDAAKAAPKEAPKEAAKPAK